MEQIGRANAAKIAEFKYPAHQYTIAWHFDQSSCHKAYTEDALNPRVMNVNPGGQQPVMRDTVWAGAVQKLVDENGVPKGMKRVLQERGINTATMVTDDMRTVLANHEDFRTEKTLLIVIFHFTLHTNTVALITHWMCKAMCMAHCGSLKSIGCVDKPDGSWNTEWQRFYSTNFVVCTGWIVWWLTSTAFSNCVK